MKYLVPRISHFEYLTSISCTSCTTNISLWISHFSCTNQNISLCIRVRLKGIPRDVFRFMLIGSLSATNSYQSRNCLQRHYYQNRYKFQSCGNLWVHVWVLPGFIFRKFNGIPRDVFGFIPIGSIHPTLSHQTRFCLQPEIQRIVWEISGYVMVRDSETMNKIKMQLICVSETLSEDELICLLENLKSSQLPMSQIARTLLKAG